MSSSEHQGPIRLAISTCPNDTFAFHAILNREIDLCGLDFDIKLLDIQQLNDGLIADRFDVVKASFHAAIRSADAWVVLPSGSALGFGVGPLLLAARADTQPEQTSKSGPTITLCPGELTTAKMLFQLYYGSAVSSGRTQIRHCVFSEIMPSLKTQTAEFGVCIHEGRFTWKNEGLFLVEDLGARWEEETDAPLPLGGILARRELNDDLIATLQDVIQRSVQYGLDHREQTLPTMRTYAEEFSDQVLMSHVDLYVNAWTVDLGEVGRRALRVLAAKTRECGLAGQSSRALEVWSPT